MRDDIDTYDEGEVDHYNHQAMELSLILLRVTSRSTFFLSGDSFEKPVWNVWFIASIS